MSGIRLDICGLELKRGKQEVLRDVSFCVLPGECVGLLGASGCGKSTLLRAIYGGTSSPGLVRFNGLEAQQLPEASLGFVPQDDILHTGLKVQKALVYSALIREFAHNTEASTAELEKLAQEAVTRVLAEVGLSDKANLAIASLSGGQRKRVSIASELLGQPGMLLLDEPTSGLDPALEVHFMELFRQIASRGCTVIAATHITQSLHLLDLVALLAGGTLVWYGPPQEICAWFGVSSFSQLYEKVDENSSMWAERYRQSPLCNQYVIKRLKEAP